ncbi:Ku protein [Cohnella faecalis]|uniref:Non-homologous end joining protein Ku n=1 Tax=Cohnella faecalis TaxID=2315694 RepID=A0A398CML1_9BACL|nr:Ku protein [Cohnella faecalis]RIE03843.1 Ku protein [Cohnella faecalis]
MHTVWKGAISFGLVHVPVKMFTATEDKDVHLRYIHKECGTPIANVRTCPHCDKQVEWEEISRGYEYEKGRFVLFDSEELDAIKPDTTRTIQILDFVDLTEIDPLYYQKAYYLSPDQAGSGAYSLLLEAMRQSGKIGIAKVAIRSKSSLAAIRAVDNCICMETMHFPDEIRALAQVPNLPEKTAAINERELTMAKMLIEQLSTPFEPEKYTDDYRSALLEAIQRKVSGEGADVVTAPAAERTNVIDLMAALQASLEAVKPGGGAAAGMGGQALTGKSAASKAGARKATGGKSKAGASEDDPVAVENATSDKTSKVSPSTNRPARSSKSKVSAADSVADTPTGDKPATRGTRSRSKKEIAP